MKLADEFPRGDRRVAVADEERERERERERMTGAKKGGCAKRVEAGGIPRYRGIDCSDID